MSSQVAYVSETPRSRSVRSPSQEVTRTAITPLKLEQDEEGLWVVLVAGRSLNAFRVDDGPDKDSRQISAFSIEGRSWIWDITIYDDHLLVDKKDPQCIWSGDVKELDTPTQVARFFVQEVLPDYDARPSLSA